MKKILFIVGSLRRESFNRMVAREVEQLIDNRAEVVWLDYHDVPLLNQDMEFPAPPEVARVRKAVSEADALWIFTPEYNHSYPGVLKNLLDWLSRPIEADASNPVTAIAGKKACVTGMGGIRATLGSRNDLVHLLDFLQVSTLQPTRGLAVNDDAWETGQARLSDLQKATLKEQTEEFLKYIAD